MRELKIRLSDEQCDALATEAKRNGLSYFDHCRLKLLAGLDQPLRIDQPVAPVLHSAVSAPAPQMAETKKQTSEPDDRMDRLEAIVMHLANVLQGQPAQHYHGEDAQASQGPIDIDGMISAQLADAEARGLTEHVPDEVEEVMRVSGMRPLARRAPKFSPSNVPRHLNQLG